MYKHTATHLGKTYTRNSESRRYAYALVGRKWNVVTRQYVGGGTRARYKTTVVRESGVNPNWSLIGWSRDEETARQRGNTAINTQGYAEVLLVPAKVVESTPKKPRLWHLRTYTAIKGSECGWPYPEHCQEIHLRQLGTRVRTFETAEQAAIAAESALVRGEIDAWAVSMQYAPPTKGAVRGQPSDYGPATQRWWEPGQVWHDLPEFVGSIEDRAGPNAKGWRPVQPVQ